MPPALSYPAGTLKANAYRFCFLEICVSEAIRRNRFLGFVGICDMPPALSYPAGTLKANAYRGWLFWDCDRSNYLLAD